jgi:hypothetical protein
MGEAHAVAEMYNWMLQEGHTDDQIGLADFVSQHPALVAADDTSRIILNEYWGDGRSEFPAHGIHAWFVHMPGLKNNPRFFRYADLVRKYAGPYGIAAVDTTNSNPRPMLVYVALLVAILVLIAFSTGFVAGRHRKRM